MTAWTPTNLGAAVTVWYKADAITGKSDTDAISQWDDSSGNARHATQATGSNQPAYRTSVMNSLPVVRFDGSSDRLTIPSSGISAQPFAYAVVVDSNANDDAILVSSSGVAHLHKNGSGILEVNGGSALTCGAVGTAPTVLVGIYSGASSAGWRDGTQGGTGNAGTGFPSGTITLGSAGGSLFLSGDIAEVLIYNGALGTDDRQRLEGYLAHKWGTTASLPSDHPYKTAAPQRSGKTGLRFSISMGLRMRTLR